jgi:hypothetical protein
MKVLDKFMIRRYNYSREIILFIISHRKIVEVEKIRNQRVNYLMEFRCNAFCNI